MLKVRIEFGIEEDDVSAKVFEDGKEVSDKLQNLIVVLAPRSKPIYAKNVPWFLIELLIDPIAANHYLNTVFEEAVAKRQERQDALLSSGG